MEGEERKDGGGERERKKHDHTKWSDSLEGVQGH